MDVFVRGFAIGLAVAAPVGPIGLLCIRRALERGFTAGFSAGIGAAAADAVYASLAVWALAVTTRVLAVAARPVHVGGGLVLVVLGLRVLRDARKPARETPAAATVSHLSGFATTFLLTLANPATVLSFSAVVAGSALGARALGGAGATRLVCGVFVGSAVWWLVLCAGVAASRRAITPRLRVAIAIASGGAFVAFGIAALSSA